MVTGSRAAGGMFLEPSFDTIAGGLCCVNYSTPLCELYETPVGTIRHLCMMSTTPFEPFITVLRHMNYMTLYYTALHRPWTGPKLHHSVRHSKASQCPHYGVTITD